MKKLNTLILSLFFAINVIGQSESTTQLSIEIDPAPFILGGYSFSLKYAPKSLPKTAFMASVYGSEFPNSMMNSTNKDNGWTDLKLETSYAVFAEFYLNNKRRGFYYGPSVFLYNKSVELASTNQEAKFKTIYPNIRAGYIWYPFKAVDLYLNPWLNIGSEINLDNNNHINEIEFEASSLHYIVALHIGYTFKLKKKNASN